MIAMMKMTENQKKHHDSLVKHYYLVGKGPNQMGTRPPPHPGNVHLEAFSSSNTFLYLSHSLVANKRGDECQAQVQIAKKGEYGKKGEGRCSFCWRMEMPIRH